tara:strand:- start:391 stop:588 length:198 start_codon:yes stop_codon:yes gene_type:complete
MSNISINRLQKLGEYLSDKYIPETLFWVDKKEKISVVFMTQMLGYPHSQNLKDDLRTFVYQSIIL